MFWNGLGLAVNLTDYKKKIENYDYDKLQTERQKLLDKQCLNYIYMPINSEYEIHRLNIADSPEEKNRIYVRKKVAMATKDINAKLDAFVEDFSSCWRYFNKEFLKTTSMPYIATVDLEGKTVPFSDRLSLQGLCAYMHYLMFISDALEIYSNFEVAAQLALEKEQDVDTKFDRDKFFTRFFLPNSIDAVYKNLIKEKTINERMKEIGNVKKAVEPKNDNLNK